MQDLGEALYSSMPTSAIEHVKVNEAIDKGLWDAVRAIEERILLLEQRADLADADGDREAARHMRSEAERARKKYQPLPELVLDSSFSSSD